MTHAAREAIERDLTEHASSQVRSVLMRVLELAPDHQMRAKIAINVLASVLAHATAEAAFHVCVESGLKPPDSLDPEKTREAARRIAELVHWLAIPADKSANG